ncbi:hypothetical protein [Sinorhizobium meliloti]|nr:hypothetical protein [Sinorhizobium meliloti]
MLNDNRQQYVIQSNDPKGDEGFGKFLGVGESGHPKLALDMAELRGYR